MNTLISFRRFLSYCLARISYKRMIARLLNISPLEVDRIYKEIINSKFMQEILNRSGMKNGFFDFNMAMVLRAPTLYVACRLLRPEIVVETGVADGFSSAFILYALENNKKGHLYSIDLPNQKGQELGTGKFSGWLVPEEFKYKWTLIFGSSKERLPNLLEELREIDIFYHDSDHSYDNMMFEFEAAIKYIKQNGILISDDVTENGAFEEFCKRLSLESRKLFKFGIARK